MKQMHLTQPRLATLPQKRKVLVLKLRIQSTALILQCNAHHHLIVIMVHASPGFHLFQDGTPFSLASSVPWHGRVPCRRTKSAEGIWKSGVLATLWHASIQVPWWPCDHGMDRKCI